MRTERDNSSFDIWMILGYHRDESQLSDRCAMKKRTTIALDERVIERIREKARAEGKSFQDCANELLWLGLQAAKALQRKPKPLPVFQLGAAKVDIADRVGLCDLLEQE